MKISWLLWWIISGIVSAGFILSSIFIWVREVDGSGAVQTPSIRIVSFIVLIFAFAIPAFIQLVWLLINIIIGKRQEGNLS